jgi:hypothetical protein
VIYLALGIAVLLFVAVLRLGRVVERSLGVVATVRDATSVMASSSLSEDEKETRIQRDALAMLRAFAILAFWSAIAVGVSILAVVLGSLAGFYDLESAQAAAESWEVILVVCVVMTAALVLRRR